MYEVPSYRAYTSNPSIEERLQPAYERRHSNSNKSFTAEQNAKYRDEHNSKSVSKWQCCTTFYYIIVFLVAAVLVGYCFYQLRWDDKFANLLQALHVLYPDMRLKLLSLPQISSVIEYSLIVFSSLICFSTLICGIHGAHRKKGSCVTAYMVSSIFGIVIGSAAGIALLLTHGLFLEAVIFPSVNIYGQDNQTTSLIDKQQTLLECCGRRGPEDYREAICLQSSTNAGLCVKSTAVDVAVPKSCCVNKALANCNGGIPGNPKKDELINVKGCEYQVKEIVMKKFRMLASMLLSLSGVLIIGVILSRYLHKAIEKSKTIYLVTSHHDRVENSLHHGVASHHQPSRTSYHSPYNEERKSDHRVRRNHFPDESHSSHHHRQFLHVPYGRSSPHSTSRELYAHYYTGEGPNTTNNAPATYRKSKATVKIPVHALLDSDTELTDDHHYPFDKLIVIPVQAENQHKHRVRTVSITRKGRYYTGDSDSEINNSDSSSFAESEGLASPRRSPSRRSSNRRRSTGYLRRKRFRPRRRSRSAGTLGRRRRRGPPRRRRKML